MARAYRLDFGCEQPRCTAPGERGTGRDGETGIGRCQSTSVNISAPNRVRLPIDDPFEGDPKLLALDAKGYLSYSRLLR